MGYGSRSLDSNGNCYRHTVVYIDLETNEEKTIHFGMYGTLGPAKSKATSWIYQQNGRPEYNRDPSIMVIERYDEITSGWDRV